MTKKSLKNKKNFNISILVLAVVVTVGVLAFSGMQKNIASVIGMATTSKPASGKTTEYPGEPKVQAEIQEDSLPTVKLESAPEVDKKGLYFDGVNDFLSGPAVKGAIGSTFTVDVWFNPSSSIQSAVLAAQSDSKTGWSFELNGGKATLWFSDSSDQWKSVKNKQTIKAGLWHHAAFVNDSGNLRVFVDGVSSDVVKVGSIVSGQSLNIGGLDGYPFYKGSLGEIRISTSARYKDNFEKSTLPSVLDDKTIALYRLDEGEGQLTLDSSLNKYNLVLGSTKAAQSSDPSWY